MRKKLIVILIILTVIFVAVSYIAGDSNLLSSQLEIDSPNSVEEKATRQKIKPVNTNEDSLSQTKSNAQTQTSVIKQCDAKLFTIDNPEIMSKLSETDNMLEILRANPSTNSKIAFSILDFNKSAIRLEELIEKEPDNELVQFLYFSKCSIPSKDSKCLTKSVNSITLDVENGALWLQLANIAAAKKDLNEFTTALENTISAPTFNDYWADTIHLFDQALLENGFTDKISRRIFATIMSSAQASDLSKLVIYCGDMSSHRADVAQLCADAGVRISSQAKTILSESIGYTLQITAFKALGENEKAKSLRKIKNQANLISKHDIVASNLILFDEELLDYWYHNLKIHGEKNIKPTID